MDIFLMDLVTSEIINLTKSVTEESEPVFSPDNKFILYRTLLLVWFLIIQFLILAPRKL